MKILERMFFVLAFLVVGAMLVGFVHFADREVHPATKSCTCGPTCPTPTAKSWPIPASMEKLR